MKLSFFLAGIRTPNWEALYNSIAQTTSIRDYEIIFVGPEGLPGVLQCKDNVRFVKDFGCPSRCYQLGLIHSKGEYVVWPADDGTFSPTMAVDKAFSIIPPGPKGVVSLKYFEGEGGHKQSSDSWWKIDRHTRRKRACKFIPKNYFMIMNALIRRDYMMEIGGFDCSFEHLGLGAVDLSIRLQNDGAKVVLGDKFLDISHLPAAQGDHGPIHHAHINNDEPLFRKIYNSPTLSVRSRIDIDNWKLAEERWVRRFGK